MTPRIKFVYVLAMPFSGTTLFSRLASFHQDVASIGEMVNVISKSKEGQYLCSCGLKLVECDFWLAISHRMSRKGHGLDLNDFRIKPLHFIAGSAYRIHKKLPKLLPNSPNSFPALLTAAKFFGRTRLAKRISAFSYSIIEESGKSIFLDASKDPNLLFYLAANERVELVVTRLLRDPRGVALSMMNNMRRESFRSCLSEWVYFYKKIEWLLAAFPNQREITLRYEDLCNSPERYMARFYDGIGISPMNADSSESRISHIIGNRMRLSSLDNIAIDDKWRNVLSDKDLNDAREIAGPYATRLGYMF